MSQNIKTLYWISVDSTNGIEEFIDSTRRYYKTVWSDGYTEIMDLQVISPGEAIKEIKTTGNSPKYKSVKLRYNIITS
jgi:hypothetical protein